MYLKSLAGALSGLVVALALVACTPTGRTELLPVEGDAFVGPADARIVVVEYGSPTCPACKAWHDTNYPILKADYVDTGKVKFVFREFAIHGPVDAAIFAVARCSGSKDFFAVLDEAFLRQNTIVEASMKGSPIDELNSLGAKFQLSAEQVKSCINDKTIIGRINDVRADAAGKGIDSTPTFMVDGVVLKSNTWPDVKAAIDAGLGGSASEPAPAPTETPIAPAAAPASSGGPVHGPDEPH
ncbi:MAG: thioredoxin domain-containing protein [Hyphomonadaceae bacterium]